MTKKVEDFYDEFTDTQLKAGLHERHILMYEKLLDLGLSNSSSILEIGAGIGMITSLIRRKVTYGNYLCNDISPKSLALNKKLNNQSNVRFEVGDIVDLNVDEKFDYITLFDVLEHIPSEQHTSLFEKLKLLLNKNGVIFINIPVPECLLYYHKFEPDSLQVIDQPLFADELIPKAYKANLVLNYFQTYDIWHKSEYQMMYFKHSFEWEPKRLPEKSGKLVRKIIRKIKGRPY